jgi:hypothetical protein
MRGLSRTIPTSVKGVEVSTKPLQLRTTTGSNDVIGFDEGAVRQNIEQLAISYVNYFVS